MAAGHWRWRRFSIVTGVDRSSPVRRTIQGAVQGAVRYVVLDAVPAAGDALLQAMTPRSLSSIAVEAPTPRRRRRSARRRS